mgnify:CR=1 FL=1
MKENNETVSEDFHANNKSAAEEIANDTSALKETIKTSDKPEKEKVEEDAVNDEAILDIYLDIANDQSEIEEIVSVESALEDIVNDESIFTAFPV